MSKRYRVSVDVCGYSRGKQSWVVEASSEEDAKENYYMGTLVEECTVRDDREEEASSVEELE